MTKLFLTCLFQFQHTAARRRLVLQSVETLIKSQVSTHSRPKAAGNYINHNGTEELVSTHSRPKAAGIGNKAAFGGQDVSTHSRPKAAGSTRPKNKQRPPVSTHSRPKAAGRRMWRKSAY